MVAAMGGLPWAPPVFLERRGGQDREDRGVQMCVNFYYRGGCPWLWDVLPIIEPHALVNNLLQTQVNGYTCVVPRTKCTLHGTSVKWQIKWHLQRGIMQNSVNKTGVTSC